MGACKPDRRIFEDALAKLGVPAQETIFIDDIERNLDGAAALGKMCIRDRYIPETLMAAVIELEDAYERLRTDPSFLAELDSLLRNYAGRPSLLYYAEKLTQLLGGAKTVSYTHLRARL